jgi:hypothetical protein
VEEVEASGKLCDVFACFILVNSLCDFVAQRSSDVEFHDKVDEVFIGEGVHELNEWIHADQEFECL